MTATQVSIIIMWLAIAVNLAATWISNQHRRNLAKRLQELSEPNMRHNISLQIHDGLLARIGVSGDLIDRAVTDLAFLHGQVYGGAVLKDHCPICSSTLPELEDMRVRLQSMRVEIRDEHP